MSEKIYAWILRLYPAHFREAYGGDALELFRQRAHAERGFLARARLWWDLLVDLAISIPREYARTPALASRSMVNRPSFRFLERDAPSTEALLIGGLLSLVPVLALSVPVPHHQRPHVSHVYPHRPVYVPWRPAFQTVTGAEPRSRAGGFRMLPVVFLNVPQEAPPDAAKLDAAERRKVIQAAATDLKQHYFAAGTGQKMADALFTHEKAGDYDGLTDGAAFADLLTKHLQQAGDDLHLDVAYIPGGIANRPPEQAAEARERYRKALEQENCTFEKVDILANNIGYWKLNTFPDVAFCRQAATAAMAKLNSADTIIFDLRDNRGGYEEMVALIAAYLFDHPEYLYSPREVPTETSWTRSPVPGNSLADKPAYLLTSHTTMSAAEQFSYDLKMLKRATLIGETTRGATHSGVFYRIDDHFGIGIPEVKAVNPFSNRDWAVVGVEPDVKVPVAEALAKAQQLAAAKLHKK